MVVISPQAVAVVAIGPLLAVLSPLGLTDDGGPVLAAQPWDAENRLASVVAGTTTTTFAYDAKGARASKTPLGGSTTHGACPEPGRRVNRYFEKDVTTGEVTKHYFLGDRTVAVKKGADPIQYVLAEHLGSTAVTADGTSSRTTKYAPYGATRSETGAGPLGASSPTDRRYTGQRLDASTGLYFYNARYYDPGLARFVSPDDRVPEPRNPQDLNRYTYVRNNPLRYVDPQGRTPLDIATRLGECRLCGGIAAGGGGFFLGEVAVDAGKKAIAAIAENAGNFDVVGAVSQAFPFQTAAIVLLRDVVQPLLEAVTAPDDLGTLYAVTNPNGSRGSPATRRRSGSVLRSWRRKAGSTKAAATNQKRLFVLAGVRSPPVDRISPCGIQRRAKSTARMLAGPRALGNRCHASARL